MDLRLRVGRAVVLPGLPDESPLVGTGQAAIQSRTASKLPQRGPVTKLWGRSSTNPLALIPAPGFPGIMVATTGNDSVR